MVILLSGVNVGTVSPAIRQEPIEVVDRAGTDLGQYVAQKGEGVDSMSLAGGDEAAEDGRGAAILVTTYE